MSPATLADVSTPLLALRVLLSEHPALPAGMIRVSSIFPGQLDIGLHDDLGGFETWRAALGISPDLVTCHTQNDGRTWVLKAGAIFAGARIELTGFADVPQPDGGMR
ncbi:hypothetical protein [Actinacidiphila sp. ITFR-21]|uniref:hypothetical protein n=1 Tax=Actinacidiphila sp. ITFR-21 TaxID=3075199 RepID=UPI00288B04F3|nr:hypothetical protein [Streptomyces sp. ITFR-21]WNI15723.1 hypothetical protein RLT57_09430 [Streptomyces sp. ITFR-21]